METFNSEDCYLGTIGHNSVRRVSPMNNEREYKKKNEEDVCLHFLDYYNKQHGCDIKIDRRGDPKKREPDFLCTGGVAVEVTELYTSQKDAKLTSKMRNEKSDPELHGSLNSPSGVGMKRWENVTRGGIHMHQGILKKTEKMKKGHYDGCSDTTKIFLVCDALQTIAGINSYMLNFVEQIKGGLIGYSSEKGKKFDGIFVVRVDVPPYDMTQSFTVNFFGREVVCEALWEQE